MAGDKAAARPGQSGQHEMPQVGTSVEQVIAPGRLSAEGSLLLGRFDLAEEFRCSERQVDRLRSSGALPAPIFLGGGRSPRWSRATIARWIACGCPSAERFESIERAWEERP